MAQLDRKNRQFYDDLIDDERKKFSNYLMIRWSSAVVGSRELQEYYVQSCNHYLNRDFFAINRHPKLQWLCATAVSPGLGSQRHSWIAPRKKEKTSSQVKNALLELFPQRKIQDIDILAQLNTETDIRTLLGEHGR